MFYLKVKRFLDIILSFLGIVILSPVFLFTAAAIKLDSPGEIIFKQQRIGLNGKVFNIYKFRSMCVGAEKTGTGQYSFKGDPRVTKVGKVIRALSIDELPQFFNILKGEMSIIGPRPTLTYHPWKFEDYTNEQKKRFLVRPGVTGLAQINGRKDISWDKRIEYDIEYIENMSFFNDFKIFFKTIIKILMRADNMNTGETVSHSLNKKTA
ncbi:sugar transferase [Tyzzerella sp. An114]|uniref:sugar transferase n=1 Tax=Tyzzerella sp. An114 TaxID=1965545 RepID=UPI000B4525F5|nr:sugar transferase [Tyzzerella sp. An114]OUQ56641.1 sugar transferase [Tyzzerella sp. An114]